MITLFFSVVFFCLGYWFRGTTAGQWVKKAFGKETTVQ